MQPERDQSIVSGLRATADQIRWQGAAMGVDAAFLRLRLALKAGFDPNQPRVPAGSPEGGRWTRVGANPAEGGTRLAQADRPRGYPVDLLEEERRGGHTIAAHVGKSPAHLLTRVRAGRALFGFATVARRRDGSFPSLTAATKLVNATLALNQAIVDQVASGVLADAFITAVFSTNTGVEAFLPGLNASPYLRDTYGVGVLIVHDPTAPNGYRIVTAYPRND